MSHFECYKSSHFECYATVLPSILAKQQAVVEALEIRFDRVPDGLREEISHISDSARLHVLLRSAIRCADLESFVKDL
jgi:hypothetical protein